MFLYLCTHACLCWCSSGNTVLAMLKVEDLYDSVNSEVMYKKELLQRNLFHSHTCVTTLIRCYQERAPKRDRIQIIISYTCTMRICPLIHSMFDVFSIAYWFLSLSSRVSVLLLLINLLVFSKLLLIVNICLICWKLFGGQCCS